MVVVTGASGHVGANLVRKLREKGRRVRVLVHRDRRAFEGLDIETATGDILDTWSLVSAFDGAEYVYHLAVHISISKRDAAEAARLNREGTRNVVDACMEAGVRRLVHFSSIHALSSKPRDEMIDESRPLAEPSDPVYDRSKADAERVVLEAVEKGLDAVIVNPTAILGPWDFKPSYMGKFLLALCHHEFKSLVKGGFDWVDVRDVVQGALTAEQRGRKGGQGAVVHRAHVARLYGTALHGCPFTDEEIGASLHEGVPSRTTEPPFHQSRQGNPGARVQAPSATGDVEGFPRMV
jgi:dihydroflavonol-4-reductase